MNKKVLVYGGGTVSYYADHLAISAPAYGSTARKIASLCKTKFSTCDVELRLTNMALGGHGPINTVEELDTSVEQAINDPLTKVIFFSSAVCDYAPERGHKYAKRPATSLNPTLNITLKSTPKIISKIRSKRKDIFLVGFKTVTNVDLDEMFSAGLTLCKKSSCNLVLVNDTAKRINMIVTPEESSYCITSDREKVLNELVDIAWHRSHLTFTRSTVVDGSPVSWEDERVPSSLRQVVDYCIDHKAYKPFMGSTVGHFAVKLSDTEFLSSIRKTNFVDLKKNGLVYVKTDGPDTVLAYGAKPSVGGQSQRIIFKDHVGYDCVVHFHSPLLENPRDNIPVVSQREVECGSHQCGKNTSNGLKTFGNLKAVMLNNHGPNIIFNKDIDPQEVIDFVSSNFDLEAKTKGY